MQDSQAFCLIGWGKQDSQALSISELGRRTHRTLHEITESYYRKQAFYTKTLAIYFQAQHLLLYHLLPYRRPDGYTLITLGIVTWNQTYHSACWVPASSVKSHLHDSPLQSILGDLVLGVYPDW